MAKSIFVCSGQRYDLPFHKYGRISFDIKEYLDNPKRHKLVVLTGGEDINPAIYGHPQHIRCGSPNYGRDARDMMVAYTAMRCGIPLVGICRGAQLINAICGGWLIQDCNNHGVWHNIRTTDGRLIWVSSTHHQMMVPPDDAVLLAWAEPRRSTRYYGGRFSSRVPRPPSEADCIYYPSFNALAMQYHPEYMPQDSQAFLYAQELVETYLKVRPVGEKRQSPFFSLPKPEITEEALREENTILSKMEKKEREDYLAERWAEEVIAYKKRELMMVGVSEGEAQEQARAHLESLFEKEETQENQEANVVSHERID